MNNVKKSFVVLLSIGMFLSAVTTFIPALNTPTLAVLALMYSVSQLYNSYEIYLENQDFKTARLEGKGVMIISWTIEGNRGGSGTWNTYQSWE